MKVVRATETGIEQALSVLRNGGVVAHATETCYGLACDLQNAAAVERLFAMKQRPTNQPVSALFASVEDSERFLEWNEAATQLAVKHLPGPLTIIVKALPGCPLCVTPEGGERVGVRISPHPTAQALAERFGAPLSTTSANVHGQPNPYSVTDLQLQYADAKLQPDLVLDDGQLPEAGASTVVDTSEGQLHVLRRGNIDPK